MTTRLARFPLLAIAIPIGLLMAAAELAGGGSFLGAGLAFAIVVAYAGGVTLLGRRSETLSVLAGRPVDERWAHINLEACAWALGISGTVALIAVAVGLATGSAWQPFALMGGVMAAAYVGALMMVRSRH